MLAGAGGIDVVLLVVAADESIKPQTREHFDICRMLGIPRGLIALTKSDLVDADMLGLVRLEVEDLCAARFWRARPSCRSARKPAPGSMGEKGAAASGAGNTGEGRDPAFSPAD